MGALINKGEIELPAVKNGGFQALYKKHRQRWYSLGPLLPHFDKHK